MQLGRAVAYAIFAVVHIAEHGSNGPIQGKDIATTCEMPPGRLLKILQQLVRARILSSERGPGGGFRLRKAPAEISMLEIVETIEGPIDGGLRICDGVVNMDRPKQVVSRACADVAGFARDRMRAISVKSLMS